MTTSIKPFFILLITTDTQGGVVMNYQPDAALPDTSKWGQRLTSAQADAIRLELADKLDIVNDGIAAGGAWALRKDARAALAALSTAYIKGHRHNYDNAVVRIVQVGGKTMRDLREVDHWKLQFSDDCLNDWEDSYSYQQKFTSRKLARAAAKECTGGGIKYRAVPVYKTEG